MGPRVTHALLSTNISRFSRVGFIGVITHLRVMAPGKHSSHGRRQRLERAAELYLRGCYARRTAARVDELAAKLGLARPYLSRLMQEVFGMPVRDFLRERKLAHARYLLETTRLSTGQVGLASAFGTSPTFYRCFKAAFGMTPGEYRKQVTK